MRDKNSSLLRTIVNYGHEKFYTFDVRCVDRSAVADVAGVADVPVGLVHWIGEQVRVAPRWHSGKLVRFSCLDS